LDVWIAGIGEIPCKPAYNSHDFREMLYMAAKQAYEDAEMSPSDLDGIVSSGFDFYEGISITDSYTPDQVGGRLKFNTLVSNDSLNALLQAFMLLKTNKFKNIMVTCYSKASNILNYSEVVLNSFDPHLIRPLAPHHVVIAALDAKAYLMKSGAQVSDLSIVAVKNKRNACSNPMAAYSEFTSLDKVESSMFVSEPLRKDHVAELCDYAAAVILTSDVRLGKIAVKGVGNSFGTHSSDLSTREWGMTRWAKKAAEKAMKMAGVKKVDFIEVSEPFAHVELMALDALQMSDRPAYRMLREGGYDVDGHMPVNVSGGCIGMGYPLNASGLQRTVQAIKILIRTSLRSCLVLSSDGEVVDAGTAVVLAKEG